MALQTPDSPTDTSRASLATQAFRVVAGLIIAASFGVWVYAYSGRADRPPPDLLADTAIGAQAEQICAAAVADVAAMPGATVAVDQADRSRQVHVSTDRFELMVDQLAEVGVSAPEDRVIMDGWLDDWRTLLSDRRAYADAVLADADAGFFQTRVADNERLDRRLTRVANTNRMPSCGTPTDVG